jgi:hypothetical protein
MFNLGPANAIVSQAASNKSACYGATQPNGCGQNQDQREFKD